PFVFVAGQAIFDRDVLTLDKASLFETLTPRGKKLRSVAGRPGAEEPDYWHARLLRPRRERPNDGRAAEQRDELAPFQLHKVHALTLAKVTAYWIGEHQVRGLPPCGISVRPMTVQGRVSRAPT